MILATYLVHLALVNAIGEFHIAGEAPASKASLEPRLAPRKQKPAAYIVFCTGTQSGIIVLTLKTKRVKEYTTERLDLTAMTADSARDFVLDYLQDAGWRGRKIGNNSLVIQGASNEDGALDLLSEITCKSFRNRPSAVHVPIAKGCGGVTSHNK